MIYAWSPEIKGDFESWTLQPWQQRGLKIYNRLSEIPSSAVLVASHYAPWWPGLKQWIAESRPWIEIEFGYWGPDTKTRQTRRVTYCGHHNLKMQPRSSSRQHLFPEPSIQPWRQTSGEYVLVIEPQERILFERTGLTMEQWKTKIQQQIQPLWSGNLVWRPKAGSRRTRFQQFVQQLSKAHAVVGERTMACTEACLLGVPGYTIDTSMSTLLMGPLQNLARPCFPDRTDWWEHVCHSQFTIAEFMTPGPADLVEQYQM